MEKFPEAGDAFAYAPISQLVGLQVEPGGVGEAIVRLPVGERMHNPMGVVHGGVIALLADAAMGIAFGRTLVDTSSFATMEMKVSYLRPVKKSLLTATAKMVARGLRVGFVECVITDSRSKEIARASCTCTINSLAPTSNPLAATDDSQLTTDNSRKLLGGLPVPKAADGKS